MWDVVGYALRCDGSGEFYWNEYLLHDRKSGLKWLTENQGHWSLGDPVENKAPVSLPGGGVRHRGMTFQPFLRGRARVVAVAGGFPWAIKPGEVGAVADFISPPWMLSREGSREGTSWTLNRYVPGDQIQSAFAPVESLPPRSGVAPHQPFPGEGLEGRAWRLTGLALVLLLAVQVAGSLTASRGIVLRQVVSPPVDPGTKVAVLEPFRVPGGPCAVQISLKTTARDVAIRTEAAVRHETTGARSVAYFDLRSGGGAGGPATDHRVLPALEAGAYVLTLIPPPVAPVEVTVTADVAVWRNFWITAALALLARMVLSVWGWRFEASRWSQSELHED